MSRPIVYNYRPQEGGQSQSLPIFLDLHGRKCLLVGGGVGGARTDQECVATELVEGTVSLALDALADDAPIQGREVVAIGADLVWPGQGEGGL